MTYLKHYPEPWEVHPARNRARDKRERDHAARVNERIAAGEAFTFLYFEGPGTFKAVVLDGSPAALALQKAKLTPARSVTRPAPDWLGGYRKGWGGDLGLVSTMKEEKMPTKKCRNCGKPLTDGETLTCCSKRTPRPKGERITKADLLEAEAFINVMAAPRKFAFDGNSTGYQLEDVTDGCRIVIPRAKLAEAYRQALAMIQGLAMKEAA